MRSSHGAPRGTRPIRAVSAAGLVAVLLFAGCSDDKDDAASTSTSTGVGTATTVRPVDTSFTGQGSGDFCRLITTFTAEQEKVSPTASAAELEAAFEESLTSINQAAEVAPAEIKGDVVAVAESIKAVEQAMSDAGYDVNKVDASALASLQSGTFLNSVTRLGSYLTTVCQTNPGG